MKIRFILKYSFLLILLAGHTLAMSQKKSQIINWSPVQQENFNGQPIKLLSFQDASNVSTFGLLPVYSKMFEIPAPGLDYEFRLTNEVFSSFEDAEQLPEIMDIDLLEEQIVFWQETITVREKSYVVFKILPLQKNSTSGIVEKLISFDLDAQLIPGGSYKGQGPEDEYAETSVLAQGDWYKISVAESGIHKVTFQHLEQMGFEMSGLQSRLIRFYGNGGGMLPQANSDFRYDDLQENAILLEDGGDGTFDSGDYFLFFGQSPNTWTFNSARKVYKHSFNKYTDSTYYFITIGTEDGKRIQNLEQSPIPGEEVITTYDDYAVHEVDGRSLIKSGAEWYGEEFYEQKIQDFYFSFPHRDISEDVYVVGDFVARSIKSSSFTVRLNQDSVFTDNVSAIPNGNSIKYANSSNKSKWFKAENDEDITVTLEYNFKEENAIGWLNYIELNVVKYLRYDEHQFMFRSIKSAVKDQISEFRVLDANENFRVWDVSTPLVPMQVEISMQESTCKYVLETDSIREFIGFDGSDYLEPGLSGKIFNQNLHAHQNATFIIITPPEFADQAERLKELHEKLDDMSVIVVDINEIYNEFSSGSPDVTAVRDFVRMIYQRSESPSALKYLLMFGDGSYDPKNRIEDNEYYLPTFQSKMSIWITSSFVTDDYFGLMDPGEGNDANGNVDIGIGRFPVNTHDEAVLMVDKVEEYMTMSPKIQGAWRNSLCFIADDEDNNLHFYQADTILVSLIQRNNKSVNINKIYFDSYTQETTASGDSYPEATSDINKQVNKGAVIVNYTGHGGELGLGHEKVVQINDILSWENTDALPVFITATCEFSRFDNPGLTSAGELVLLNQIGGGIALFTTTRLAFASSNLLLNKRIYDTLFRAYPHHHPRMGDLVMYSKTPSNTNLRNFILLGDPALKLALPGLNVVTDSINGVPAELYSDTLNANGEIRISGHIEDQFNTGVVYSDFNGTLFPELFDKPEVVRTLGNDASSYPVNFDSQNNVLCKGKASVKEGRFAFSFILPQDISYNFGEGKISYYAADSLNDASGYYSGVVIGGNNQEAVSDNNGPDIQIYLNDTSSSYEDEINPNPVMLARLSDVSGINSAGAGIGHDITLRVDGSSYYTIVLNEYFDPTLDDPTSGTIMFPISTLENGEHTLELKAWDMFNNSTVSSLTFTVSDDIEVELLDVINYPNPFRDYTNFTFQHNQFEGDLEVEICIYNFYGQKVHTIGPEAVTTLGYYAAPIYWNGTSEGGAPLQAGVYLYSIKVTNDSGQYAERIQKMILTD